MVELCGLDRQNGSFSPEALPGVLGTSFCTKVREKYYEFGETKTSKPTLTAFVLVVDVFCAGAA